MLATLFLSQGTPMLLAGDELLRSQQGNNNAWCQDNELGWVDWRLAETNADMLRFVRELIALRRRHPCLMRRHFLGGRNQGGGGLPEVSWHGTGSGEPEWDDPQARFLAFTLAAIDAKEEDLHVVLNMSEHSHRLALPELPNRVWYRAPTGTGIGPSSATTGRTVRGTGCRPSTIPTTRR